MSKYVDEVITVKTAFVVTLTVTGRRRDISDYSLRAFIRQRLMGAQKLYSRTKSKVEIYAAVEKQAPLIEERLKELEDSLDRLRDELRDSDD